MTSSSRGKPASRPVFKTLILGVILFSPGIGICQKLPQSPLADLAGIPASKFTKVIRNSTSPDKRFSVTLGSKDGSMPNWQEVAFEDRKEFLLEPNESGNYLVDLRRDRVTGILDGDHFGTGIRYNHESASHHWSPDGRWLVETQSWKWHTAVCSVYRVDANGALTGKLDFLATAHQAVIRRLREKGAKVPDGGGGSGYTIIVTVSGIKNDGSMTTHLSADSSRSKLEEGDYLNLSVMARVSQSENGELTATLTQVTPAE